MRKIGGTILVMGQVFHDDPAFEGECEDKKKLRFYLADQKKPYTRDDRKAFLKRVKKRRAKKGYR